MFMNLRLWIRRGVVSLVAISAAGAGLYYGNDYWQQRESKKFEWANVVRDFNDCNLSAALSQLGFFPPVHLGSTLYASTDRDPFGHFLALSPADLSGVWIDPEVEDSLSNGKSTPKSINLMSQCEARIKEGYSSIWLDIGKYYIATGNVNAKKWLQQAIEQGIPDAETIIGHGYRLGLLSSVKNEKQALIHYMNAANGGSPKAQYYVAEMLAPENPKVARKYLMASAYSGNLAAAYVLQDSFGYLGTSSDEASAKSNYFWSLIFTYLDNEQLRTDPILLGSNRKSPNLRVAPTEYAYEGLPSRALKSSWESSRRTEVQRYNAANVERNGKRLEDQLSANARIQVQELVQKWIEERTNALGSVAAPAPVKQQPVNLPVRPWKSLRSPVCDGLSSPSVQAAAQLFKGYRQFVWAVSAKAKEGSAGAIGTAVAVDSTLLATNCHVVNGRDDITVTQEGISMPATVWAANLERDTCILEVTNKIPFVKNASKVTQIEIGSNAYALGNPQGLNLTFSNGIVSGIRKSEGREFIQTTAAISPGSSGGALLDDRGNLLGITTFYLRGGQSMNFAIPIAEYCRQ